MNLKRLFDLQRELDERINREHPPDPGEDRLAKKILALQVELGECANEWRGFKFWSKNPKPNVVHKGSCKKCDFWDMLRGGNEPGIRPDGTTCDCYMGLRPANTVLEEYVDCLHFILSIGLEIEYKEESAKYLHEHNVQIFKKSSVVDQFNECFDSIQEMRRDSDVFEYYEDVFLSFIALGELLGFSWEQVEEAYYSKNQVNHERQTQGY